MEPEQPKPKSFNTLYIFIGIVIVGLIAVFTIKRGGNTPQAPAVTTNQINSASESSVPAGPVKEFTVVGTNYAYDPSTITVNKGDTVKINFKDNDGPHNLMVVGYNVGTPTIEGGDTTSITFVADKVGSFEFFCSVSNHRSLGMSGTLVVQ